MFRLSHCRPVLFALLLAGVSYVVPVTEPRHTAAANCAPFTQDNSTTFTTSTTRHTTSTPVTINATGPDQTRTRVLGVLNGTTIFDQTAVAAVGSAAEVALEAAAKNALVSAGGPGAIVSGPVQLSSLREQTTTSSGPVNQLNHVETSFTTTYILGPATILIGVDQSVSCLVPAGTENYNTNTHTETFIDAVTTVTTGFANVTTLQFTATVPLQPIPQAVQNPAAVAIVSALGGIGNGTHNATPVPARPVATAPQGQNVTSMPTLRPPSTGDAGLSN